jgi:hypothetical protein
MVDKLKVINFLQDFGCATLEQLQILFDDKSNNFKFVLDGNMVSRKNNIYVHNRCKIDNKMLAAIDVLCKYKGKFIKFYKNYDPIYITFFTKDNIMYHIIVADEDNEKGVVKIVNSYPLSIPKAYKLILAFPDREELSNIDCEIPFLYTSYPEFEILNNDTDENI